MNWLVTEKENSLGIEPRTPNGKALIDVPAIHLAMSDVETVSPPQYGEYQQKNVRPFIWTCPLAVHTGHVPSPSNTEAVGRHHNLLPDRQASAGQGKA